MADELLVVEGATVAYHGRAVGVEGLSLSVARREIVALVGPNGAGKTSTLRAIAGFLRREPGRLLTGSITFDGWPIAGRSPSHVARRGIAFVPERGKIFTALTVAEHLRLSAPGRARSALSEATALALELFPALEPHLHHPAGYLSGGERQMLAMVSALCAKPRMLLIDELSQGLAPGTAAAIGAKLLEIRAAGTAVLLVEQNARLAAQIADRMYVLESGHLAAEGGPGELARTGALAQAYLGIRPAATSPSAAGNRS